jgi:hypothetical protein
LHDANLFYFAHKFLLKFRGFLKTHLGTALFLNALEPVTVTLICRCGGPGEP